MYWYTLTLVATVSASSLIAGRSIQPDSSSGLQAALSNLGVAADSIPSHDTLQSHGVNSRCDIACTILSKSFGQNNVYQQNSTPYTAFTSSYWSAEQAEVRPACVFTPESAQAVSALVLLARVTGCPFAAKSGGHAAFAGGSSIEGGITMSFQNMKNISLSSDKTVASIQPGNVWLDVYTELQKDDVIVIGGRVAGIGVGGLTTGGGISYLSGVYGWACDNVVSYEVVIANGEIVTASPTENPDLYWALRGGGNNFGLVTQFNLNAYTLPESTIWGGTRTYNSSYFDQVAEAFAYAADNAPADPRAGQWAAWIETQGVQLVGSEEYYAAPNGQDSVVWKEFDAIPSISDTRSNRTVAEYAAIEATNNPDGLRESYSVISIKLDADLLKTAQQIYYDNVGPAQNVTGALVVMVWQAITVPILEKMRKNGGNALGLDLDGGPYAIIMVSSWWQNAVDDATIYGVAANILDKIKEAAAAKGLDNDYIYMNYASADQDVIASYGAESKARLISIAEKYDPQGVFQKLQPGYFKLAGPQKTSA